MPAPAKTIEQCQKAISHAVSRAYDVSLPPYDISREHITRDVRSFISKHAGRPHTDLKIADVAALALSRAERRSGDEALASTIADLIDGGISLERTALSPRNLEDHMSRHRAERARTNPLPADEKVKARAGAPRVIRRGGGSAIAVKKPPPRAVTVSVGSRVRYLRLDDETEHDVTLATPKPGEPRGPSRKIPPGSPLGLALRGATQGSVVSFNLAGTPVEIEILSIEPA
jgi:transcription elongation GreA/GreB family factor